MELYVAPRHRRAIRSRRTNWIGRILAVLAFAAAAVFLMAAGIDSAFAQQPRLNANRAAWAQEIRATKLQTYWCAYDGSVAMVRAGAQDEFQIMKAVTRMCKDRILAVLSAAGYPEDEMYLEGAKVIQAGFADAVNAMGGGRRR